MQTSWRATRRTIPNVNGPMLRIAHLYADEMNIYGDRGNILTLQKRAEWRGIQVEIRAVGRGPAPDLSDIDLIFWGGGQDRDQELVFTDAAAHKIEAIREAIGGGAVVLAISYWGSTTSQPTARSCLGWASSISTPSPARIGTSATS